LNDSMSNRTRIRRACDGTFPILAYFKSREAVQCLTQFVLSILLESFGRHRHVGSTTPSSLAHGSLKPTSSHGASFTETMNHAAETFSNHPFCWYDGSSNKLKHRFPEPWNQKIGRGVLTRTVPGYPLAQPKNAAPQGRNCGDCEMDWPRPYFNVPLQTRR
jgi:hypothetical protein